MIILGINNGHDGSACLVVDGRLVGAIATERVSRVKKMSGITEESVNYLLGDHGITIDDIDVVAFSHFENADFPLPAYFTKEIMKMDGGIFGHPKTFIHVPHHIAHCSSAYYTSNFKEAACLSIDSSSYLVPDVNSSICLADQNKINFIKVQGTMIGSAYSQFTEYLNFGPSVVKAGSLMGMAAYGNVPKVLVDNIDEYIDRVNEIDPDTGFQSTKVYQEFMKEWLGTDEFAPSSSINSFSTMDLSAGIQYLFEKSILKIIKDEIIPLGIKNLCLSGGSFLNCNTNSAIADLGYFDNIHHFPACGDDGIAVGAALYVSHNVFNESRHEYKQNEIVLLGNKQDVVDPDYDLIAKEIANGKIVAWFMGRSEFGPRALGSRSILADPRNPQNKDILNFVIKNREWFRPFAPVVLEERAGEWFSPGTPSPYMLYTQKVIRDGVPAITHVDGTARIQTINEKFNKHLYSLISSFDKITGVPMLINTSLNGNGEPILETENDAIQFFNKNKNIHMLVLNGKIITR